jgi:hypothetical protein
MLGAKRSTMLEHSHDVRGLLDSGRDGGDSNHAVVSGVGFTGGVPSRDPQLHGPK